MSTRDYFSIAQNTIQRGRTRREAKANRLRDAFTTRKIGTGKTRGIPVVIYEVGLFFESDKGHERYSVINLFLDQLPGYDTNSGTPSILA